jgi:putative tricarboxylic transport membrane protein
MPSGARQGWLIATGAKLALCLFALWQSWLLPLTDKLGPGPGFFPFWLSLIGAAFSIALLVSLARSPSIDDPSAEQLMPDAWASRRIGAIVVSLLVTSALMEVVGFQLAMLAFIVVLVVALGARQWIAIAIFAVAGSFGVHWVFTRWLDVMLPSGMLGI